MKYVLILILFSLFACERDVPTKPTVINGIVIDENENPIPDVPFRFIGSEFNGFLAPVNVTFNKSGTTNENGEFHVSQVIPKGTNIFDVGIENRSPNYLREGIEYSLNDTEFTRWGGGSYNYEYFGKELNIKYKIVPL